ncbi:glycosyltransferase family 4 protein [uncultured Prevotella sp.]|uniref:glycosyltransferase family 4 protein n=1 Tax=uncultured Prevotella sp. TaxID=159272 RepID=UPI00258F10A4|nr:glycosyltransferase family 4 protein [uncultured Prevotella sp.]
MKVLFLTISRLIDISERNIYNDLMREFRDEGHDVYIVSPRERRYGEQTSLTANNGVHVLGVKTLNLIKTNIIEKGLGQLLMQQQFIKAIDKHLKDISFDLVLYSTPPITLNGVVKHLKKRHPNTVSYLMLKDIFPQNAVDLGMMSKTGIKGIFYHYFRHKEKALYQVSDYIGCMSPRNVDYLLRNNPEIAEEKVEEAPNSLALKVKDLVSGEDLELNEKGDRLFIRSKYQIPSELPVFIYGGSLGKPQGVDYIIKCLDAVSNRTDCYFLIVGGGVEAHNLKAWMNRGVHNNVKMIDYLHKDDFDMLIRACDVGLIFLDNRFTIPNYPSRLLSYLENKMPIICATDVNTDVGCIAEKNGYGYWCESVKPEDFTALVDKILASDRKSMGEKGYKFLKDNYLVEHTYNTIVKHINKN